MKLTAALLAACLGLWLIPGHADAQASSVRITTKKNTKKASKTTGPTTYDNYATREWTETTSFTVEVQNFASRPLTDLVIKWAILVRPLYNETLKVVDGEQKAGDLKLGQRFSFETDSVQTTEKYYAQNETKPYWVGNQKPRVEGYVIEVYSAGKLVGSDVVPPSTRKQIEDLKTEAGKPPADDPKVHRF